MYSSCLQGLTAQCSNCSIQHDSGDHTSACSEEAICPSKVSLYTSILLVLNCIKHIRNVDAVITLWFCVGDSKIIPEGTERGSPKVAGSSWAFGPVAAAAKSLQSCLTLCDPIDGSPSGFPVPGILQARTLEWVAIRTSIWVQISPHFGEFTSLFSELYYM